MGRSVPPAIGPGMITRQVRVRARDVVFLKGIVEALEGVAQVFAERGGDLTLAAPRGRERELDSIIDDLCRELGAMRVDEPSETHAAGLSDSGAPALQPAPSPRTTRGPGETS